MIDENNIDMDEQLADEGMIAMAELGMIGRLRLKLAKIPLLLFCLIVPNEVMSAFTENNPTITLDESEGETNDG